MYGIYNHLAGLGKFSRNKHEDSTVSTTRSDRTDKFRGVSVVVIEEKYVSVTDAVDEIRRKNVLPPHYNRLPFVFGIGISKDELQICNVTESATTVVLQANLNSMAGRFSCVVAAVNIARALKLFQRDNLIIASLAFNEWQTRNLMRIRLELNFVEVEFSADECFDRMQKYYLTTVNVPNLEHLYVGEGEETASILGIKLAPVGCSRQ